MRTCDTCRKPSLLQKCSKCKKKLRKTKFMYAKSKAQESMHRICITCHIDKIPQISTRQEVHMPEYNRSRVPPITTPNGSDLYKQQADEVRRAGEAYRRRNNIQDEESDEEAFIEEGMAEFARLFPYCQM